MVEPRQVVTKEQSQTLAENLVLAAVSLVARTRGLFGREAFARTRFVGTEVDVLRPRDGNDEAAQVLRWLNSEFKPRLESDTLGAVELEVRVGHTGGGLDTEQFYEAFMIQVARRDREAIRAEVAVAGAVTFLRTLSTFLSTLDRLHDESTLSVVLSVSSPARGDQGPGTSAEGNDGSEQHRGAELTPAATTAHESQQRLDRNEDGVPIRDRGPRSSAGDRQRRHMEDVRAASTNTGSHQLVLRARLSRDHDLSSSSVRQCQRVRCPRVQGEDGWEQRSMGTLGRNRCATSALGCAGLPIPSAISSEMRAANRYSAALPTHSPRGGGGGGGAAGGGQHPLSMKSCADTRGYTFAAHGQTTMKSGPSGPSGSSRAPAGGSQAPAAIGARIHVVGSVTSKRSHRPETAFDDRMEPLAVVTYKRRRL